MFLTPQSKKSNLSRGFNHVHKWKSFFSLFFNNETYKTNVKRVLLTLQSSKNSNEWPNNNFDLYNVAGLRQHTWLVTTIFIYAYKRENNFCGLSINQL